MDKIDELCSSNESYEKKVKKLKKLRKRVNEEINAYNEYLNLIDKAEEDLENGKYLELMILEKNKLINSFKIKIPVTLISLISGTILTTDLINMISAKIYESGIYDLKSITVLIGSAVADSLTVLVGSQLLKDLYSTKLYNNEINSYQRRLK